MGKYLAEVRDQIEAHSAAFKPLLTEFVASHSAEARAAIQLQIMTMDLASQVTKFEASFIRWAEDARKLRELDAKNGDEKTSD